MMPLFSILFFILCLCNCGTPLTLNFIGEFLSLYGAFERMPVLGALAASSIVFSAAYSIYLFNRVVFGGTFSKFFSDSFIDISKREFFIIFSLVLFTVLFGIYPNLILDGLHYSVSSLIYSVNWDLFFLRSTNTSSLSNGSTVVQIIERYVSSRLRRSQPPSGARDLKKRKNKISRLRRQRIYCARRSRAFYIIKDLSFLVLRRSFFYPPPESIYFSSYTSKRYYYFS